MTPISFPLWSVSCLYSHEFFFIFPSHICNYCSQLIYLCFVLMRWRFPLRNSTVKQAKPAIGHTGPHMRKHKLIFHAMSLNLQFCLGKHLLPLFLGLLHIVISSFLSFLLIHNMQWCLRPLKNLMGVSCGFKGVSSSAHGHLRLGINGESWNALNEITNMIENALHCTSSKQSCACVELLWKEMIVLWNFWLQIFPTSLLRYNLRFYIFIFTNFSCLHLISIYQFTLCIVMLR
jgi:hypothetical protein